MLFHPSFVNEVLSTRQRSFTKGRGLTLNRQRLMGNGLATSSGDFWRKQRRLIQPAFHRDRIAGFLDTMVQFSERLFDRWRPDGVIDMQHEMHKLAMAIVSKTLFNAEVESEVEELIAVHTLSNSYLARRVGNPLLFLVPEWLTIPVNRDYQRAVKRLVGFMENIIDRRRRGLDQADDLLDLLLSARYEDGSAMSAQQVRDEAMTIFMAGHDTTANALGFAWYLLSTNPEVQRRLAEEVHAVLGGRTPTLADVPRLQYADWVVKETMRLYSPAWTVGRQASEDCEIGGQTVRAGTTVLLSQWVIHRDPRFWDEPAAFRPERWADSLEKRLAPGTYFPFGGGPRVCIGETFAAMEATIILAMTVQRFEIRPVAGHQIVPETQMATLKAKYGVSVSVHNRNF